MEDQKNELSKNLNNIAMAVSGIGSKKIKTRKHFWSSITKCTFFKFKESVKNASSLIEESKRNMEQSIESLKDEFSKKLKTIELAVDRIDSKDIHI